MVAQGLTRTQTLVGLMLVSSMLAAACKPQPKHGWKPNVPPELKAWYEKLPAKGYQGGTRYEIGYPDWYLNLNVPDKKLTSEAVELGRFLFYDKIMSSDESVSCGTCHIQKYSFSDNKKVSTGVGGRQGKRNSMALVNLLFDDRFFWDGRSPSLEAQVLEPIENPVEMDLPLDELQARLSYHPIYPSLFERAFNQKEITRENLATALASFVYSLASYSSASDYFNAFENGRLKWSDIPKKYRGQWNTYKKGTRSSLQLTLTCGLCHSTALRLGQKAFDDIGLDLTPEDGFAVVTGKKSDVGKYKTLSLRNITVTAPYMHDGRFQTIDEVMTHYEKDMKASPNLSFRLKENGRPMQMKITPQIKKAVADVWPLFTDQEFLHNPAFSDPFTSR